MRITTRLSTAGACSGFLSMPVMREPAERYIIEDRMLDEAKVRREMANNPGIMISSDDDRDTLSFAVELLDRMKRALEGLMGEEDSGVRKTGDGSKKTTAERRFDNGRFAFVRVDIRRNGGGGFRVFLSATDPRSVVGHAREFAEIYAQSFADNILAISDSLGEDGIPVVLIEKEGCAGVFAKARIRVDHQKLRERLAKCPCRHGIQCSPVQRGCPLFDRETGRCKYDSRPWEDEKR